MGYKGIIRGDWYYDERIEPMNLCLRLNYKVLISYSKNVIKNTSFIKIIIIIFGQ